MDTFDRSKNRGYNPYAGGARAQMPAGASTSVHTAPGLNPPPSGYTSNYGPPNGPYVDKQQWHLQHPNNSIVNAPPSSYPVNENGSGYTLPKAPLSSQASQMNPGGTQGAYRKNQFAQSNFSDSNRYARPIRSEHNRGTDGLSEMTRPNAPTPYVNGDHVSNLSVQSVQQMPGPPPNYSSQFSDKPTSTRGPFGHMPNGGHYLKGSGAPPPRVADVGPPMSPGNQGGPGIGRPPTQPPQMHVNGQQPSFSAPVGTLVQPNISMQTHQMEPIDENLQCDPLYMAPTTGVVPVSESMSKKLKITMGAVVQPLAENPNGNAVPVVNFGASSVIRCKECRAYINPFVKFIENGRRWKCNMCSTLNNVPKPYYCHLDSNNQRADIAERPELRKGQVEFVAPGEYMVRPPQAPCFVFIIDVSMNAIQSGVLQSTIDTIKTSLDSLSGNPRTQVGFITFDKVVQFYNLKHTLNAPQMMVVSDLNDIFLPVPEDMLVNLLESRSIINALLDALPEMFKGTQCPHAAVGAAINAAFLIMSHIGGKMCIFQCSLPSMGPGALTMRDNPKILGTEQEHTLLSPSNPFYRKKATELLKHQIGVDLFLFSRDYTDVATLSNLPKFTGGSTYYYPAYDSRRDGPKFSNELQRALSQEMAWEAVARIRITNGMRFTNFFGNYQFRGKDLLALPNFSADSTFSCEFVHEQQNLNTEAVCLQSALLYTTSQGERRIRVNTIALPTTSSEADVFQSIKSDALCNVMMKKACECARQNGLSSGRSMLQTECTAIVRAHQASSVNNSLNGYSGIQQHQIKSQLSDLPEAMALLPLNTMAMLKGLAFRGGNTIRSDERAYYFALISSMPISQSVPFIYPRMYSVHTLSASAGKVVIAEDAISSRAVRCYNGDAIEMPEQMGLTAERLTSDGAFILDNGVDIFLWLGRAVPEEVVVSLFGLKTLEGIDCNQLRLETGGDDLCIRVRNIIRACRSRNPIFGTIRIVQEGGPLESRFFMHLVEDRANFSGGTFSYSEFMNILQRQSSGVHSLGRRY